MGTAKGVRAGKAYIELGVQDALTKGLRAAQQQLSAFGARIRNIGIGITAASSAVLTPLAAAVTSFATRGDAIAKAAKRIGVSAAALSQLGFAAEQSGLSMESLEVGLLRLNRLLGDAVGGSQAARSALEKIGLSVKSLTGLSVEDRFAAVADALSRIDDSALRAAAVMRIFGRGGARLIPLLNAGAAGIARLREEADRLGLTISPADAAGAEQLADAMNRVRRTVTAVAAQIGAALAPVVTALANRIARIVSSVVAWIRKNRELVVSATKLVVLLGGIGGTLVVAGVAIQTFAFALGGLASLAGVVTGALGVMTSAVAAAMTPLGALASAVLGAGAAMIYLSGAGDRALSFLRGSFRQLSDVASETFSGIADALAAGEIELAAEVLWAGLRLVWETGAIAIRKTWSDLKRWIVGITVDAMAVVLKAGNNAWGAIAEVGLSAAHLMQMGWRSFVDFIARSFVRVAGVLERIWNRLRGIFDASFDAAAANVESLARQEAELSEMSRKTEDERERLARKRAFRLEMNRLVTDVTADEISRAHVESLRDDEGDDNAENARRQLREAGEKLRELREKARAARLDEEERVKQREIIPPDFSGPVVDAVQSVSRRMNAIGTFSVANLAQIAGEDPNAKKAAKAAESTAENTRQMLQLMQRNRLVFS